MALKNFPIDFVRQVIIQTLAEEKLKDNKYFGGDSQVNLFSFYEQLQKDEEVNRYVEIYRDLTEQQNRTGLIMNGTIIAPENPTITNLNQCLIVPMSFTCNFRVKLANRDMALETINNLIKVLKGRKQDMVEFDNGKLFKLGTLGNRISGKPNIEKGDLLFSEPSPNATINSTYIANKISALTDLGFVNELANRDYFYGSWIGGSNMKIYTYERLLGTVALDYCDIEDIHYYGGSGNNRIINGWVNFKSQDTYGQVPEQISISITFGVSDGNTDIYQTISATASGDDISLDSEGHIVGSALFELNEIPESTFADCGQVDTWIDDYSDPTLNEYVKIVDDGNTKGVIFPPEHNGINGRYMISLSFDSLRCDEPRTLNSEEYCMISFGGSATLVDSSVMLGNKLVKLQIKRKLIKADTDINISDSDYYWLEPLELPSGNNADTQVNQLLKNKFLTNTHTDSLAISLQYTFIVDKNIDILYQFFKYARYGKQGTSGNNYLDGITPNMIYEIKEIWSSWGQVEVETFKAKVVESIDIENTESDALTITIPFQVQGDNN